MKNTLLIQEYYIYQLSSSDSRTIFWGITPDGLIAATIAVIVPITLIYLSGWWTTKKERDQTKAIVKMNINELINNIEGTIDNINESLREFSVDYDGNYSTITPDRTFVQIFVGLGYNKIFDTYANNPNDVVSISRFWSSVTLYDRETTELPKIYVKFIEDRNAASNAWNITVHEIVLKVMMIEASYHGSRLDKTSKQFTFVDRIMSVMNEFRKEKTHAMREVVSKLFEPLLEIFRDPDTLFFYSQHDLPQLIEVAKSKYRNYSRLIEANGSFLNQKKENCKKYSMAIDAFKEYHNIR